MKDEITLKTPFAIQKFDNIGTFISTIYPDLKSYLQEQITKGTQKSDLESHVYSELEKHFKLFVVRNYSKKLDEYIEKEAKHANKEVMKEVLLSTISTTLSVRDAMNNKLNVDDYLISLRNTINEIDS